jgi:hypothetical protein
MHVPRHVEHDGASDGLAGEARAGAAGKDRHVELARDGNGGDDVVRVAREATPNGSMAYRLASVEYRCRVYESNRTSPASASASAPARSRVNDLPIVAVAAP